MMGAIETSISINDIRWDSPAEQFYYGMNRAYNQHDILPKDFRNISGSDMNAINSIQKVVDERVRVHQEQERIKQEMQAEMQKRRSQW